MSDKQPGIDYCCGAYCSDEGACEYCKNDKKEG